MPSIAVKTVAGKAAGDVELAECFAVSVREPELVAEPVGVDSGRGDAADPRGRRGFREVLLRSGQRRVVIA